MQRINKFPNPRFRLEGTRPLWGDSEAQHGESNGIDRLNATHTITAPSIIMWPILLEPGEKYHYQCMVWHETPCHGQMLYAGPDNHTMQTPIYDDGVKDKRINVAMSADFTVTEAEPWLLVGFATSESGAVGQCDVAYWNPLLELSSTFADRGGGRRTSSPARPCPLSANLQHGFEVVA